MKIDRINEISNSVYEMGSVALNFGGMDFTDLEHLIRRVFKDGDKVLFFVTENQNKKLKSHFEKNNLGMNIKIHDKEKEIIHYSFCLDGVEFVCSIDYDFFFNGVKFNCSIQNNLKNSLIIHPSLRLNKCVLIKETE
jgi:hypothetical protein